MRRLIPGLCLILARGEESYDLRLKSLFVSHGILSPTFHSDVYDYSVDLVHAHDEIAVTPEIDQTLPEYSGGEENLPVITIEWTGHMDNKPEATSAAVRRQVDLPDDGSTCTIEVRVAHPREPSNYSSYRLTVHQSSEPLTILKRLEGVDENGNSVLIQPLVSQDDVVYTAYVHPSADEVYLTATCASPDWLSINNANHGNGQQVSLSREKDRHSQIVEVTCGYGQFFESQQSNKYIVKLVSDYELNEIPKPKLIVDDVGQPCRFDEKGERYLCPNPKTETGRCRIVGYVDPTIRYTIESPNKEVEVRVLNELPTIPFTYRNTLNLVATSGRYNATWPVQFNVPLGGLWMRILGWILAVLLGLLVAALVLVVGTANVLGIGSPVGTSEIASSLSMVLQYFCFANVIRGNNLLTDMTDPLRWTTLYWPLPWETEAGKKSVAFLEDSISFLEQTSRQHTLGDVRDIHNAYGCVFWALVALGIMVLVHGLVMMKFALFEKNHTFPHRLLFGHWESRMIFVLSFPLSVACGMILASNEAEGMWKIVSGGVLGLLCVWSIASYLLVKTSLDSNKVTWVWNSSIREDGELEDESGYWSDVFCDQLNTQPVNRSLFKWFPSRWVSTVADIDRVSVCPQYFERDDGRSIRSVGTIKPSDVLLHGKSYPMSKNAHTVDVYRSRAPGGFCPGQRLMAGLLRTQWIDCMFTFQSLSCFHSQVVEETGEDFSIPLLIKTCQMQGPITSGRYCFFFDGARGAFVKIAESFFRISLGVCLGVALASKDFNLDTAMFAVAGVLSTAAFAWALYAKPYSRNIENYLLYAVCAVIGLSCFSFLGYSAAQDKPSVFADLFLWATAIVCCALGLYSIIVTFSVFSAVMCPPLEETKFLENLANCSLAITDNERAWKVEMPAYCKTPCRDHRATCNTIKGGKVQVSIFPTGDEPTIEFDVDDLKKVCRTGSLRPPVVCMFAPTGDGMLGYRHVNVYDKGSASSAVEEFLRNDRVTRQISGLISRSLEKYMDRGEGGKVAIHCVTVIPPKNIGRPDTRIEMSEK